MRASRRRVCCAMITTRVPSRKGLALVASLTLFFGAFSLSTNPLPAFATGPTVVAHPTDQFSASGGTVRFVAEFSEPGTIQWEVSTDGTNWTPQGHSDSNVSESTLVIPGVTTALDENRYRAVLTTATPPLETASAQLRVSESALHNFSYGYSYVENEAGKSLIFLINGVQTPPPPTTSISPVYVCYAWEVDGVRNGLAAGNSSWIGGNAAFNALFGPGLYEAVFWTNRDPDTGVPTNSLPNMTRCNELVATYQPDIRSNPVRVFPAGSLGPSAQTV